MQELQRGATTFGLNLSAQVLDKYNQYWLYLVERNRIMNLTAITDQTEVAQKHFLDSLALAAFVPMDGTKLIDIGTGAGFPGLPLKIAIPSLHLTLLDSQKKRVDFLSQLCARLALSDVTCVHARAEEWVQSESRRENYDIATSRAVAQLNMLAELCLPYVRQGGSFLAMKSVDSDDEIADAKDAISILGGQLEACHDYTLPETDIKRRLVQIRKIAPTPKQFPRRFAKIQKQPILS